MHEAECQCAHCRNWFAKGVGSGRCARCNRPIDDHPKDNAGMVQTCPKSEARHG